MSITLTSLRVEEVDYNGWVWGDKKLFSYFFYALLIYRKKGAFVGFTPSEDALFQPEKEEVKNSLQLIENPQISFLHL